MGGGAHGYGDLEEALAAAYEDAAGGGDVSVVAADGYADVAGADEGAVGGVEACPAEAGEQTLDPGVGGAVLGCGAEFVGGGHESRDIPRGDVPRPGDGDHHVGVVLADAASGLENVFDGGDGGGGAGHVLEAVVDGLVESQQRREGIGVRGDGVARDVGVEAGRGSDVGARSGEVPKVQRALPGGNGVPGVGLQRAGQRRGSGGLDDGAGGDGERLVVGVYVHEVLGVAEKVGLLAEGRSRLGVDGEVEEALAHLLAGFEAEGHGALANGQGVEVAGDMLDLVCVARGHWCVLRRWSDRRGTFYHREGEGLRAWGGGDRFRFLGCARNDTGCGAALGMAGTRARRRGSLDRVGGRAYANARPVGSRSRGNDGRVGGAGRGRSGLMGGGVTPIFTLTLTLSLDGRGDQEERDRL